MIAMHTVQDPYYCRNISSVQLYCTVALHSGRDWPVPTFARGLQYSNVPKKRGCAFSKHSGRIGAFFCLVQS